MEQSEMEQRNFMPGVCPLTTGEVVDRCMLFIEALNRVGFYNYQRVFARRVTESILLRDGDIVTALWARQCGKCLARGTMLLMADGTQKAVEDIQVGDLLMGDDSTPRTVLSLARGREGMVRVRPNSNGHESYVVNRSHILSVKTKHMGSSVQKPRQFEWITDDVCVESLLGKDLSRVQGFKVPVSFPEKEVPIEPYWLGAWLGDGCSRDVKITSADPEIVEYIEEYAKRLGMRMSRYEEDPGNAASAYVIVNDSPSRSRPNWLKWNLVELNLIQNKHIPLAYKANSEKVRLQVLAGLIDTDGHKSTDANKSSVCELVFVNRTLALDTQWLARSLGFRASITPKMVNETVYWRVMLYGELSRVPTKIARKKYEYHFLRDNPLQYGFTLEELPEDEYFGFSIDGNKRFLLGDCTVTHNTETIADVSIGLAVLLPQLAKEFPNDERFRPFAKGVWIGVFAPIMDQATTCYNRMRDHVESEYAEQMLGDPELNVKVVQSRGDTCSFSNGSMVRARSASEDSQIEGGTYHIIILEEAQRLSRSKVNKEIAPMLASTNGTMIKIGTAWMSKGGFHSSIQQNIEILRSTGKRNHFEFPWDVVVKEKRLKYEEEVKESGTGNPFHLNYENWIRGEIKRIGGLDSEEFKMNFRLIWQETRLAAVRMEMFNRNAMDGQLGRRLFERGEFPPPGWRIVAGLDVGKSNDSSVLTIGAVDPTVILQNDGFSMPVSPSEDLFGPVKETKEVLEVHQKMILNWLELQGEFEGSSGQYATVLEFLRPYMRALSAFVVDSTGMGDPVAERFGALLPNVAVIPYRFNLPSKHLLYKYYLNEVHSGRVWYPAGPSTRNSIEFDRFTQQHQDLDKRQVGSYTIVAHSDEDGHDDYPDSAALMCWGEKNLSITEELPEIEESSMDGTPGRAATVVAQNRASRYYR